MSDITQINSEIDNNSTVINNEIFDSSSTVINAEITDVGDIPSGTILLEKYSIIEKMSLNTGEATLYVCEYNNEKYAAKVYSRENAVKPDVISALRRIHSRYVARLIDFGDYNGKPVEIMSYFKNGSIQGKKYSFDELKSTIIPCINEGLNVLHNAGIIHKDLKPSNIMLNDDGKSVAIIDFGISSFETDGNTVIVTKTGMTPEYSAPEAYRGLFLEESDYYSLGITLYELFCGQSPYRGLSAEDIAKYTSIQRIPISYEIPQELKELITALTYYDITNRKDKKNPNRRWTYEEVKNWCEGKKQPIPGEGVNLNTTKIPAYKFAGNEYKDMSSLVRALTVDWKDGKKQLFRGIMSGFFKNFDPEIAGFCIDAEEDAVKNVANDDIIFFRLLYKLDPDMVSFNWKGKITESLPALGRSVLEDTQNGKNIAYNAEILDKCVLSQYLECVDSKDKTQFTAVKALENNYRVNKDDPRQKEIYLYLMGYLLSGQKIFRIKDNEFENVSQLVSYMTLLLNDSYDTFEDFCGLLIDSHNELNTQFESWLLSLGKSEEVDNWRKGMGS
jgi:hypothetical protein